TKLWDCTEPNVLGMNTRSRKWFMEFKWHRAEEIRALSGAIEAEHDGDRTALLELFWALALSNDAGGAGALAEKLVARYPGDAEIIQASWAALAVQRRWAGLVELLGPLPDASVPEPVRQHRHHLLAAAHLALGDVDKAIVHL